MLLQVKHSPYTPDTTVCASVCVQMIVAITEIFFLSSSVRLINKVCTEKEENMLEVCLHASADLLYYLMSI